MNKEGGIRFGNNDGDFVCCKSNSRRQQHTRAVQRKKKENIFHSDCRRLNKNIARNQIFVKGRKTFRVFYFSDKKDCLRNIRTRLPTRFLVNALRCFFDNDLFLFHTFLEKRVTYFVLRKVTFMQSLYINLE